VFEFVDLRSVEVVCVGCGVCLELMNGFVDVGVFIYEVFGLFCENDVCVVFVNGLLCGGYMFYG